MSKLEPRNFLPTCLLLLLRECPDHGYELAARLRPMHDGDGEACGVYRALRGLERQGLVRSQWQESDAGPARRTYSITPEGIACLDARAQDLAHAHEALHVFLDRYARVARRDPPKRSGDWPMTRGGGMQGGNGVRAADHTGRSAGR